MSPRARVITSAALFSTGGAAIKLCGFGAWQLAAARALIAAIALVLLIPEARGAWSWRSPVVGISYAAAGLFFILANKLTTAASAILIQATHPLFLLALAPLLLREPVTRRDLEFMALLAVGMVLLLSSPGRQFATAPNPALGNLLAGGCAVSWAMTLLGYRWVVKRSQAGHAAVAAAAISGNLIVCLVAVPIALPLTAGTPGDWLVVVYLGVFQLALAYVFLSRALVQVRAIEVALMGLVEPVLSATWAWLVHGETPGVRVILGGLVILAATGWHAWREEPRVPLPATVLEA